MTSEELFGQIVAKKSFLCVGLDTDIRKLPGHLSKDGDGMFDFNRAIVDATAPCSVAYKPNLAFYEAAGLEGWRAFERTVEYIRHKYPEIFIIADAKRGDIGNTSKMYARTFFETVDVDAVTLSPYMGLDTVAPFLDYKGRWAVLLALTSNASASDFEMEQTLSGQRLYQTVLDKSSRWGNVANMMYVVGATKA
ncbi:MAG: orotidine-5'-phosphate decarboxylase, partial [Rikenellaceae bacterium]|nr:orotidine-5'-phosphate decarboxylase [Rikenellaceae bacterium]